MSMVFGTVATGAVAGWLSAWVCREKARSKRAEMESLSVVMVGLHKTATLTSTRWKDGRMRVWFVLVKPFTCQRLVMEPIARALFIKALGRCRTLPYPSPASASTRSSRQSSLELAVTSQRRRLSESFWCRVRFSLGLGFSKRWFL